MRQLMITLLVGCILGFSFPVWAQPLSGAESAWLNDFCTRADPARVRELMQMQLQSDRMKHWSEVRETVLIDLVRTRKVEEGMPTEPMSWEEPARKKSLETVWFALATPRHAQMPEEVRVEWLLEGKVFYLRTILIEKPSPYYRSWDTQNIKSEGTWTVRIVSQDGRVLGTQSFSAP